jgi:hypothetical protein
LRENLGILGKREKEREEKRKKREEKRARQESIDIMVIL